MLQVGGIFYWRPLPWLLTALLIFSLTGCKSLSNQASAQPPDPEQVRSVAQSSNRLAFELLQQLSKAGDGDNVILAPLSVSTLLALLLEGADGDTAEAIAGVLHLDTVDTVPAKTTSFAALLRYLVHSVSDVELNIASAIWTNEGYPLVEQFVETMQTDFEAEVSELNLGSSEAADVIDHWVADKTKDRIKRMSDALGIPDPSAVAVLMNAVYFKGSWTNRFNVDDTRPGLFTLPGGTEIEVPMMSQQGEFPTAQGTGFQLVQLPYGEKEHFVMEVLVPDSGYALDEFVAELTPEARQEALADLAERPLWLTLPRFELEYEATEELDATLQTLGMQIAYSPESDFTRLSPRDPWLSRVAHKTYIRVDEEGSEAAGVTGGVMVESAPAQIELNRPFVFTITDTETGTILFIGTVTDPRS